MYKMWMVYESTSYYPVKYYVVNSKAPKNKVQSTWKKWQDAAQTLRDLNIRAEEVKKNEK